MMHLITQANSPFYQIEFKQTVYGPGVMLINFQQHIAAVKIQEFSRELGRCCGLNKVISMPHAFGTTDADKFGRIVEFLKQKAYISEHDYGAVMPGVIEVEKILTQQKKVVTEVNPMQRDTLFFIAESSIEDIVENINDFELVIKIVTASLSADVFESGSIPFDEVISLLKAKGIIGEKQKSILDSGLHLHKLFKGEGVLESTYSRQADAEKIPHLKVQRSILIDSILNKIFDHFKDLTAKQKFIASLSCEIFSNSFLACGEVAFITYSQLDETIKEIMSNQLSIRVEHAMADKYTMPGGRSVLLERALDRIKLTVDELRQLSQVDCTELQALINKRLNLNKESSFEENFRFSSPATIAGETHVKLMQKINNIIGGDKKGFEPFLKAMEAKQYSQAIRRACTGTSPKVFQVIEAVLDAHAQGTLQFNLNEQAGPKGYTALHYAAQREDQAVYQLLLAHGADPNVQDKEQKTAADYLVKSYGYN